MLKSPANNTSFFLRSIVDRTVESFVYELPNLVLQHPRWSVHVADYNAFG